MKNSVKYIVFSHVRLSLPVRQTGLSKSIHKSITTNSHLRGNGNFCVVERKSNLLSLLFSLFSFLSTIFFFFFTLFSFSQNNQLQSFTIKDGLPQSQVHEIVQDSIGYLWIATQGGGLARFDGDEFTVFNEKKGLKSNFVNALLLKNDMLFVGTSSGLSIYNKGKFKNYDSPRINKIVAIDETIFLASDKGIYRYTPASLEPIKTVVKIDLQAVTDIEKLSDSYVIATKKGLWILNTLQNPSKATQIDAADYTSLLKNKDILIASTFDEGLKVLKSHESLQSFYNIKRIQNVQLINNQYWVSTDSQGILVLNQAFQEIQRINEKNGLTTNNVHSVTKDNLENIWIASSGGGLFKLTQNNFNHFDKNSGLKGNRVYAVHRTNDNEIWISNSEKGIVKIDSTGIQSMDDQGFLNVKAKTIASDFKGNVWVGTDRKGILIFKKQIEQTIDSLDENTKFDMAYKKLFPDYIYTTDTISIEDGLRSNQIKKIKFSNSSAWIATYSSGIVEINLFSDQYEYYDAQNGLKDLYVNDLDIDGDNRVWYVTRNGNLGYISNGQIRDFHRTLDKSISISSILIKENTIFLGTLGDGIWTTSTTNPKDARKISGSKELNSNNIYQLIFDNENNLWAGTEKGVNKIVLDANNSIQDVFYFDRSDGFLGIETCLNAVDKDYDGNIWFGTMNGLTQYIPSKSQIQKPKPTIYFENIEVVYRPLDSININSFDKTLQLKPNQNHLSFEFKSVDINHPKKVEYRWKLNDDEYSPWSSKASVEYPFLRDGLYNFTVQARNIDWVESNEISFQFYIDKSFYEKTWFVSILYGSFLLIVILLAVNFARRVKRKNKELAMKNELLSLEQKALQLQMNPHFIFNVLNGIKAQGSLGEIGKMNDTINTFATLLRNILNNSRQEEISLQQEIKTLKDYLNLEKTMSSKSFEYHINTNTNGIDLEEILIPPMLIQPFVENSIKHGFYKIDKKGLIEIDFSIKNEFLVCSIRDNGIGIEQSLKQKKKHHPSTAMKVTRERIESLHTHHMMSVKENNGTVISFQIPLKTDF